MDPQYILRLEKIEKVLSRWLPDNQENTFPPWLAEVFPGLYETINKQLLTALYAPGIDLLSRGGKRWRPLLMTLVCEAFGGGDAAIPLAPLVEFCHNASLMHDDIEDNSDERRGKPAVHLIHGVDAAINSGSFLYFLSAACIGSWVQGLESAVPAPAPVLTAEVYDMWAGALRKLHLGQAMDIHWHRHFDIIPSVEEYYVMCKLKTGCIARFAAELGAFAAKTANAAYSKNKETCCLSAEEAGNAAEKLGVGFQILDDVKNLTTGLPGKKRGDDIVEGKKSLPVLLYLNQQPLKKETVRHCFNAAASDGINAPEAEALIREFQAAGVLTEAQERGKALIKEAGSFFAGTGCELLAAFTGLII